ncbi:hypothetical protein M0R19_04570 [Candidatus Pacearchaeota archaeon]|jgi:hypothetical protein|nr:hypothetical protein [Candidatus Pacearchaeota archaeon]
MPWPKGKPKWVGEPSPPGRDPNSDDKSKALNSLRSGKKIVKLTKVGKKLKDNIIEKQKISSQLIDQYSKNHNLQLIISDKKLLSKLTAKDFKMIALKLPIYALQHEDIVKKLDNNTLKEIALKEPGNALVNIPDRLDKETLEKVILMAPEDIDFAFGKVEDSVLKRIALKIPNDKLTSALRIKFPEVEPNDRKIRAAFFKQWVFDFDGPCSNYFRNLVGEVFDIKNVEKTKTSFNSSDPDRLKKVIKNLYKNTQKKLNQEYHPSRKITLYRGIESEVAIPFAFNSFSSSIGSADEFGSYDVIKCEVPIEKILSYPKMGSATKEEHISYKEFIVLGNYKDYIVQE